MGKFAGMADRNAIQDEMAWSERGLPPTIYGFLGSVRDRFGQRPAVTFQIMSAAGAKSETLTWNDLHRRVTQAANLFRKLGIGENDVVAYLLPNSLETAITLLGGSTAGIVNPINPLLEPEQISAILRETKAKVLVTLKSFPKTEVAQKAAEAVKFAPGVKHVLEIDLNRYLTPPKSWIVPLVRPKNPVEHKATVANFNAECARMPADKLTFEDKQQDRICALFHTGGTTGMPKIAQHRASGMIYNGWLGGRLLFDETDVLICPLPLFHVFAAYPVLMSCVASGAHMVMPTPAGYRGEGVFDNFWKLIEHWKGTFLITVPTAIAALMQRPVNADVSTLKTAICGSAPLPVELYNRFKAATGVEIAEGYGLTEATCLVSCNPVDGLKKVGSVGVPMPYTDVRILLIDGSGKITKQCGADEIGEICVSSPGVNSGATYHDADKNKDLYADVSYLRTGDLGRIDADGYLWITGRAKDLIIRSGHNIDPAEIEDALSSHPAVALVGAIGQPDAYAGELPCAYVELVKGAVVTDAELLEHAKSHIHERAAVPKHVEVVPELPKTAVGKILKNDLRKLAIARVYGETLTAAGIAAAVDNVYEDKKRGLVAQLVKSGPVDDAAIKKLLGEFTRPWEWKP